jgi:hypothetical protein
MNNTAAEMPEKIMLIYSGTGNLFFINACLALSF